MRIRFDPEFYEWESDYPVSRQAQYPEGHSIFELHFVLSDDEQAAFHESTGSKLNDVLPIQLKFGPSRYATFKILKQGRGGKTLSRKATAISRFISTNLDYVYIPAIRTAETSMNLVRGIVTRELRQLEHSPHYVTIQQEISNLQQPILDSIVAELRQSLQQFLGPSFNDVRLTDLRQLGAGCGA